MLPSYRCVWVCKLVAAPNLPNSISSFTPGVCHTVNSLLVRFIDSSPFSSSARLAPGRVPSSRKHRPWSLRFRIVILHRTVLYCTVLYYLLHTLTSQLKPMVQYSYRTALLKTTVQYRSLQRMCVSPTIPPQSRSFADVILFMPDGRAGREAWSALDWNRASLLPTLTCTVSSVHRNRFETIRLDCTVLDEILENHAAADHWNENSFIPLNLNRSIYCTLRTVQYICIIASSVWKCA